MIRNVGRRTAMVALTAGLVGAAACVPLGAMNGVVLAGGGGGMAGSSSRAAVVEGEVRLVDLRQSRIQVRDHRNRAHTVYFDRRTAVVYRQQGYPVSALERGDIVRVRAVQDRRGALLADRIDVRESVRDRGRVAVRAERLTGAVSSVDARRGHFTMQISQRQSVVVHIPPRLSRDDAQRFDRLRRGDRVRVEVVPIGRGAMELVRFR